MLLAIAALAALAVSVRPIAALVEALVARIDHPFDLEWMEGAQLLHAARLLEGEPIYRPCQDGFVPLPYPPLHFALLAALGVASGGLDYTVGRALSVAALFALLWIVVREVWRAAPTRAGREIAVVVAVASVAAGYPVVDGWYDLIRVDTLAAALLAGAAALCASLRRDDRWQWGVAAGVLLALAFFAKQTAAVYAPWLALMMWLRQRRAAVAMVVTGALCSGAALGALQWTSDGWYWTATVTALGKHDILPEAAWRAAARLWSFCPWALGVVPVAAVAARQRWLRYRTVTWLGMFLLALPQSIVASAKAAAHVNNLMMAVVLAGPVLVMCCADVDRGARAGGHGGWGDAARLAAAALLVAFGVRWDHRWPSYLPAEADRLRAEGLHRMIAALEGDVVMPEHPFVPVMHGKTTDQPITQAYHDYGALGPDAFDAFRCGQQISAPWAVLGVAPTPLMAGIIHRQYLEARRVAGSPPMRSGYRTRPTILLRRRPPEGERLRPRILGDFESGTFIGWTYAGEAFARGPQRSHRGVMGTGGHFYASSLHRERGDAATGRLESPPFVIDRDVLALSVGGGAAGVHVELKIAGRRRFVATGRNAPVMIPHLWNVARFRGRSAQLVVRDDATGGWGHIHVDDVVLYDLRGDDLR